MAYVTIDIKCTHCNMNHQDILWDKAKDLATFECSSCNEHGGERLWSGAPPFWFQDGIHSPQRGAKRDMLQESKLEGYAKSGYAGAREELAARRKHKGSR